jgi:hypothetical protein
VIFSNADVIRRVNADFVPVALKAGLVNNPPDNDEGRLYREIGRSKIFPQGICVVNSAGKVLDWVFMFDDDKSVLAFLDHARKRFAIFPDAKKPFPAERYMKFPSQKLADIEDNGKVVPIVERHSEGESCPAKPRVQQGTIIARVFGRALDKDGKPVADTVRQENYVEDRFNVPVVRQEALAKALAAAGTERFKIADDLARLLVSHAFMGELDVNPFGGVNGSKGQRKDCTFWGQKIQANGNGPVRVHVDGKSEAAGVARDGENGDGPLWQHQVKLTWEGFIEMKGNRMTRLLLVARGTEKLKRGNKNQESGRQPGGHVVFIDLDCGVRYGIIGEPVPAEEAGSADAASQVPEEARKHLAQSLGGSFLVFRDKVQKDLKLTEEQKEKLEQYLKEWIPDAMKFFEKIDGLKREEREKELGAYRPKAQAKLAAILKETMKEDQGKRLRQLELQQEGPFALNHENVEIRKDLKITEEQRKQFMAVIQEMQKKIAPLLKDVDSGGDPKEIWPKLLKIRKEHEGRIESLLSDAQKKQWKEMLGKPLDLGD